MLCALAWMVERESPLPRRASARRICAGRFAAWVLALSSAGCALPATIGMVPSDESSTNSVSESTTTMSSTSSEDSVSMTTSSSTGPTSSSTTTGSTGDTGMTSSSGGPREMTAFSIRFGDIPESGDTGSTTVNSEVGSGGGPDDDALLVKVTTSNDSCEDPNATDPCDSWAVSFTLAPEQQVPGSYDLFNDVNALGVESGTDDSSGMCSFGGGTVEGTVVIESISPTGVVGRFENTDTPIDIDLDFSFVAPRC